MKELEIVIKNPTGLHARPAKYLVNLAKQFKADIRVEHGDKKANAKSMISMLTLGAECGSQIRVLVDGEDEDAALAEIEAAIRSGLGEGEAQAEAASAPAPVAAQDRPDEAQPEGKNAISGVPAAPGIVVGPVYQLKRAEISVSEEECGPPEEEQVRLQRAIEKARGQLLRLRQQLLSSHNESEAAIFDVHLELLEDTELLEAVLARIQTGQSAALAWQKTIEERAKAVAALKDPLLAARAADLHDIGYRLLRILVGDSDSGHALPDHPVIVIARELSPSDTAGLDQSRVLGFCTATGGPTSHTAIIARAVGLPAVVGAGSGILELKDGTRVILNGSDGTLTVEPDDGAVEAARQAEQRWNALKTAAREKAAEPAVTLDGTRIEVAANIGGLKDARDALQMGAEAVGLLRTEFLFLDRTDAPSEREQTEVYSSIAREMRGLSVIVRTLDIGGDKPLPYIPMPQEENPFLGERGLRLCMARVDLFREQLRAILRASQSGHLRIMFPMVADIAEWRQARDMVEALRLELNAGPVEMGIMIEVPSAALVAEAFAAEVDFFSIGTNDLTQYTLAMDRMHPSLASKSDGLHPAVLRLIARTVDAAHQAGKWVGVCGELGADPLAVPILVGLGVDELSVSVPAIPTVKAQIRALTMTEARDLAQRALSCATAKEVREIAQAAHQGIFVR